MQREDRRCARVALSALGPIALLLVTSCGADSAGTTTGGSGIKGTSVTGVVYIGVASAFPDDCSQADPGLQEGIDVVLKNSKGDIVGTTGLQAGKMDADATGQLNLGKSVCAFNWSMPDVDVSSSAYTLSIGGTMGLSDTLTKSQVLRPILIHDGGND